MDSTHNKTTIFYLKKTIGLILLLTLAGVFLFSAYSKLFSGLSAQTSLFSLKHNFFVEGFYIDTDSFDNFRWTFLDLGISSITIAGIFARLTIGFEFLIALFLLLHIFLRKITYPVIITLLSVFTIYLVFVLIKQGNTGNCGCFGIRHEMTPLMAIVKNILMIAATVLLMYIYPVKPYKRQELLSVFIGMVALVAPFVIVPLGEDITQASTVSEPIDLTPLYQSATPPQIDLRTGKHIVAFMSLTCHHCRKAAFLLEKIHHQHPDIPLFFVLTGPAAFEKDFFKETHAEDIPHMFFRNTDAFIKIAGPGVPSLFWINNNMVERKPSYYQLDPNDMEQWLKEK